VCVSDEVDSMLKPESTKFLRLDTLRFLAASAIVTYHHKDGFGLGTYETRLHGLIVFVDLFFVISGIVISYAYWNRISSIRDYLRFLWSRVARLAPLHWATLSFYVLLGVVSQIFGAMPTDPGRYDPGCLSYNFAMLHSLIGCHQLTFNVVSWSISAEMFIYLLFPLIIAIGARRAYVLATMAVLIALALYIFASGDAGAGPWWTWTWHYGVVRAIPAFMIGSAAYAMREHLARVPGAGLACWATLAGLFVMLAIGAQPSYLLPLIYLIPILALAADTRYQPTIFLSRTASLGQLTYSVYMLHPIVITIVVLTIGQRILHLLRPEILTPVSFLLVYPISLLSLTLFELPARRFLNSLIGHKTELQTLSLGRGEAMKHGIERTAQTVEDPKSIALKPLA
jgi:peptidoglycan/LPS O-acetylase OafA/YrhL